MTLILRGNFDPPLRLEFTGNHCGENCDGLVNDYCFGFNDYTKPDGEKRLRCFACHLAEQKDKQSAMELE